MTLKVQDRSDIALALRAGLLCLAPSVPFLLIRRYYQLHTGQVNIDFFFVYFIYLVAGRLVAITLFVLVCLTEALRVLDRVYFFSDQDLLAASGFLMQVKLHVIMVTGLSVIVGISILSYLWVRSLPNRTKIRWSVMFVPMLLLCGLLFVVDAFRGFNPLAKGTNARIGTHALEETLYSLTHALIFDLRSRPSEVSPAVAATDKLRQLLNSNGSPDTNVVVVLVESMGQLENSTNANQEFAIFHDGTLLSRYSLKVGSIPFSGGTVSGEIRELCGLRAGIRVDAAIVAAHHCLPYQLGAQGYETESIHGYTGQMFHRQSWHRSIGFQHSYFLEDMEHLPDYHLCYGAFAGICDADVAHHIDGELFDLRGTDRRKFIFWITLNSHLPIGEGPAPPGPCFPGYESDVCKQLGYVANVLRSTRDIALDNRIPRTTFVIVGDHAPPYVERGKRALFIEGQVPYLILTPQEGASAEVTGVAN